MGCSAHTTTAQRSAELCAVCSVSIFIYKRVAALQPTRSASAYGGSPNGEYAYWGIVGAPMSVRGEAARLHALMANHALAEAAARGS